MRVVLDTNQLVRALMRPPQLATLLMTWEAGRFTVVCSPALRVEYDRVLASPHIQSLIYPELLRSFQDHLLPRLEIVAAPELAGICRDPDDDKVIAVALFGEVDYLVTEDEDLLTPQVVHLLQRAGVGIIASSELIDRVQRLT